MKLSTLTARARLACFVLLAVLWYVLWPTTARAENRSAGPRATPLYQQECGACHLAFPPGMLPASSWQRLLAGLPQHFGVDASLEPDARAMLSPWVMANAGTQRRIAENPPQDRISRSPWFLRQHHEVAAETFKRTSIRSAANCAACHRGAGQGDFDEDAVRIPK